MNEPLGLAYIQIGPWQLAVAVVFVVLAGALSLAHHLKLERDLAIGTLRTFAQLFAMGYLLRILFGLKSALLVVGMYMVMTWFAARIVKGRVREKSVDYFMPTLLAVQVTFFLVTFVVTGLIIGAKPWWEPQYFIPIGGMVAGNSMNALAVALDRLFSDLRARRAEVEMRLCLGADRDEASADIFREALRAGMIPSVNSMMGVGLVSIPGMMTGQIMAGADPADAVRYQIVVMLMIVASTALATFMVLHLVRKRCFGRAHNLLLKA